MASVQAGLLYSIPTPVTNISCQKLLISSGVIISGFLRKMPSARKRRLFGMVRKPKWKSRYVVISNGCVYLFKDESADGYRRAVSLFGFKDVRHEPDPLRKKIRWAFKVVDALEDKERERSLWFAAPNKDSMNEWIGKFKNEIVKTCMGHFRPSGFPFTRPSTSSDVFETNENKSSSLSAISPQVTDRQWNNIKEKSPGSINSMNSSSSDDDYTEIIDDGDDDDFHKEFNESLSNSRLDVKERQPMKMDRSRNFDHSSSVRWSSPHLHLTQFTPREKEKSPSSDRNPGRRLPLSDQRYPPTIVPRSRPPTVQKKPPPPPPPPPPPLSKSISSERINQPWTELRSSRIPPPPITSVSTFPFSVSDIESYGCGSTDEMSERSDDFQTDRFLKASFWSGGREEAERIMDTIKEEGVFMVRNAADGQDYKTLLVRSNRKTKKYKINKTQVQYIMYQEVEDELYSLHLAEQSFPTVKELLEFYLINSFPNDTVRLVKPYSEVWDPEPGVSPRE